jgi:hypothetical protein
MVRTTDEKLFSRYGSTLAEAVGVAYCLVSAETWEDLDSAHARTLLDVAMKALKKDHLVTRGAEAADWNPSDPIDRTYNTTQCLVAQHPAFADLLDYMLSRKAAKRLATIDEQFQQLNWFGLVFKRGHEVDFLWANQKAWLVGRSLGYLAVIGEPPTPV